jgi:hypothetical protein
VLFLLQSHIFGDGIKKKKHLSLGRAQPQHPHSFYVGINRSGANPILTSLSIYFCSKEIAADIEETGQ